MRGIFPRLFLSFSLTFLLAGLLSGLTLFSLSHHSVETFRRNFIEELHNNIARSVLLMGTAACTMYRYQGAQVFTDYVDEVAASSKTRLFLAMDGRLHPATQDAQVLDLAARAETSTQTITERQGETLLVARKMRLADGTAYVVVGLHRFGPPPGMNPPGPEPGHGPGPAPHDLPFPFPPHQPPAPNPEHGPGSGPHGMPGSPHHERTLAGEFFNQIFGVRFLIFLPLAGIICYALARSFSAPINRLRRISRLIAEGDLSARIGGGLGKPGNEIGDLGRDFDLMAERMEHLVNGQKRLLLDISHELRSPLARLNLALELTKKRCSDQDGNLARIGRESARLNSLISQLLTLTRSEATATESMPVALLDLLVDIVDDVTFEYSADGRHVRLLTQFPALVTGSRELLRQAIENIVRNGAYYTRAGSSVDIELVRQTDAQDHQWAVLQVRDHGPGVPEDKLPLLTEPFFRVAEARDRNSGGVGLGLAIARQVIDQHGGRLEFANSADGDGLMVTVTLPLADPTALARSPSDQEESRQGVTFS